jgi:hypothetical protein
MWKCLDIRNYRLPPALRKLSAFDSAIRLRPVLATSHGKVQIAGLTPL